MLKGVLKRISDVFDVPETVPTLRRFFVNTAFDSTFVILGILIGLAFAGTSSIQIIIGTIVTSSVALGISTGVSIFEAESMEQEIKMREMGRAMLTDLCGTQLHRISRASIILIAVINFVAPLMSGIVTLIPFFVFPPSEVKTAAWVSVGLAITILFVIGSIMGKTGGRNPVLQGIRMSIAGVAAFIICFWIESLI